MRSRALAFARDKGDSTGFDCGITVAGSRGVVVGSIGFATPRREGSRSFGIRTEPSQVFAAAKKYNRRPAISKT
jgi:hypothetical protein